MTTTEPMEPTFGHSAQPAAGREVVEFTLLLLRDHLRALERLASAEKSTVARLLRRIIREYLDHVTHPDSDAAEPE
jgi:hypothetical protein